MRLLIRAICVIGVLISIPSNALWVCRQWLEKRKRQREIIRLVDSYRRRGRL